MAGSYEQLLKQQEIYKKQLKDIEFQENSKELEDLLLGDETNQAIKRLEAYGRPLSLFIELLYKELYGTPLPYSNEDIVNRSGDALNRFYSIDPSFKSNFSPDDLIVKETNKIVEVKKAVLDNGTTKDNYETITSYSSGNIKLSILTGDEYRENLGDYYDGNQFNFVMNGRNPTIRYQEDLNEHEYIKAISNWYKETYKSNSNIYYNGVIIKQFTAGIVNSNVYFDYINTDGFSTQFFNEEDEFRFDSSKYVRQARHKSSGGYITNEDFVEDVLKLFLPESVTQIKKINFIFSLETTYISQRETMNIIQNMEKIKKYFKVDEIEIIFLELGPTPLVPKKFLRTMYNLVNTRIKNLHNYLSISPYEIETKSENKQVLKKPIKKTATKKFPKQIIVDPKKNKPIKRKTKSTKKKPSRYSKNRGIKIDNTNKQTNDVNANYVDSIESTNQSIGSSKKYFGIKSNKEYLELKKEVESVDRRERIRLWDEFKLKNNYDEPSLGKEIDEHIQKSSEQMNYAMLGNKVVSSINTENYSKVNTMISILTEREKETIREINDIKTLIVSESKSEEGWERIKGEGMELQFELMEEKLKLEALLLEYQRAIKTLLPILSTMNSKKSTNVKYNRAKQDDIKKMKFFFEEDGIDVGLRKLEEVQSSLNDGTNKPYKSGEYIYFNYKEFLEMKEIKEIIEYNRKKYKKGRK